MMWDKQRILTGLFVCAFSAAVYAYAGSPSIAMQNMERLQTIRDAKPQIAALQAEVQSHPDRIKAWAKLGEIDMSIGRYSSSAEAWKHAVLLTGGNPAVILQYNKALIFAANGTVTDDAKKGLEMVLKLNPGNPEARYFLALRDLQDGNTQQAMQKMKALYHDLPQDSPIKEIIDRQIGRK